VRVQGVGVSYSYWHAQSFIFSCRKTDDVRENLTDEESVARKGTEPGMTALTCAQTRSDF